MDRFVVRKRTAEDDGNIEKCTKIQNKSNYYLLQWTFKGVHNVSYNSKRYASYNIAVHVTFVSDYDDNQNVQIYCRSYRWKDLRKLI